MLQLPRAAAVPETLRSLDTARHYLSRLIARFDEGPRCLMHGDAHLGNTFYPQHGGDCGFIDWQTHARGHWAFDTASESYRQMAFYGFAWALCPPELQAEEVCTTCAERVVAAIDDLTTLEALDA